MSASANESRNRGEADDELFLVNHKGKVRYEARIDRRKILCHHLDFLTNMDRKAYRTYAGILLRELPCDVVSALPGSWSSFDPDQRTM